jgi:hypothetical protein
MAIIEDRLSTTVVPDTDIPPEDRYRPTLLEDYEGGPIAIQDTTGGANYQPWALSYHPGGIIRLTPEIAGSPVDLLTVPGCSQLSFCFDQNARPSVTYIIGNNMFLYWYDSTLGDFTTTEYSTVRSSLLSMDDKRRRLVSYSDMLLWYTVETLPGVYTLYMRRQRDRFLTEFTMKVDCPPYMSRGGMHEGLRGQIVLRAGVG